MAKVTDRTLFVRSVDASQVDVFSLGVVMYEVFSKSSTLVTILLEGTEEECILYAYRVCAGRAW
jgi:hypothetical protein